MPYKLLFRVEYDYTVELPSLPEGDDSIQSEEDLVKFVNDGNAVHHVFMVTKTWKTNDGVTHSRPEEFATYPVDNELDEAEVHISELVKVSEDGYEEKSLWTI